MAAHFSLGDKIKTSAAAGPDGVAGWIVRNKQPLLINNFDKKRGVLGYYEGGEEDRIRAFMGVPVQGVNGALCIDSRKTYSFGEKDQKVLSQFADLVATLCTEQLRVESWQVDREYYQCLRQISGLRRQFPRWSVFRARLLELLSETSGYKYCSLAVRDELGRSYFIEGANENFFPETEFGTPHFPLGSGLVGWVFRNHTPVFLGEDEIKTSAPLFGKNVPTPPFKSVICLPLGFSKRTRGVLILAHVLSKPVSEELKAFVQVIAEHLVLFLENLYLKNRLIVPDA